MMMTVRRHPVTLMLAANGASAILGMVSLSTMLALLEVPDFAVIGVLLGVGTLISMGVDLRLIDLAARRFVDQQQTSDSAGLAVARSAVLLFLLQGVAVVLLSLAALGLLGSYLLSRPVPLWWHCSAAMFCGMQLSMSGLAGLVRYCGSFAWAAALRVFFQATSTVLVVTMLCTTGGLDGYFAALLASAISGLAIAVLICGHVVRQRLGGGLFSTRSHTEIGAILSGVRSLGAGGLFSAGWMLTQAGDTLVVAAFANDVTTGIYRIARQIVDAVQGLINAVPHYYEPTIVAALKQGDWSGYRRHRRNILASGMALAIVSMLVIVPALDLITHRLLPRYTVIVPPLGALLLTVAIRLAVQPWLWARAIAFGGMGRFALWLLAGAIAHLTIIALLAIPGILTATTAAMASWVGLLVLFLPYTLETWRRRRATASAVPPASNRNH